jgi:NAD(P)-dependent dehydrogenase (short-subunit alcohol dehydrogenase family)
MSSSSDPYQRLRLTDRVAIVTGAGSGIGQATAQLLAARGAKVVVADLNLEAAGGTVTSIEGEGGVAVAQQVDVAREPEVETMVAATVEHFGSVDIAINNAGVGGAGLDLTTLELEVMQRKININLFGVLLCMKYEIRQMLEQETPGTVVNVASAAGLVGMRGVIDYGTSKAGVVGATRGAAVDYAARGVRVNAVAPGSTETGFSSGPLDPEIKKVRDAHPIGRIGRPHEIAETMAWLASDAASFVTGAIISVDGGYTAV